MTVLLIVLVVALVWTMKEDLFDNSMYCRHCGATLDPDTRYCHECRRVDR